MSFCSDAGKRDELLRRFASYNSTQQSPSSPKAESQKAGPSSSGTKTKASEGKHAAPVTVSPEAAKDPASTKSLDSVIMALRKLREGIVAIKRADDFAVQAYLFNIRLAVLTKLPESYHPACLYLLNQLHHMHPLTAIELQEVVSYLILDAACRRGNLEEAFSLRRRHRVRDVKVDRALSSLVHDNWILFRETRRAVDGHMARIMDFAADDMRMRSLKSLGRTYLSVDLKYLEAVTERKWEELVRVDEVGWELDGERVVIRRVKAKS